MEVISLILRRRFSGKEVVDVADVEQAGKDLKLLHDNMFMSINSLCGLHVKVERGKDGFPLNWLKNLVSFFYVFEAGIEKLHPKERQNCISHTLPRCAGLY